MLLKHTSQRLQKHLTRTLGLVGKYALRTAARAPERQFVVLSHPLDNTGAPLIVVQILREIVALHGAARTRVIAPSCTPNLAAQLAELSITVEKPLPSHRLAALHMRLQPDDFVLVNTSAVDSGYFEHLLEKLADHTLRRVYWYVHEDMESLRMVNARLTEAPLRQRISELLKSRALVLLAPSEKIRRAYASLYDFPAIHRVAYRPEVGQQHASARRTAADFDRIDFLLTGNPADGRKGHMLVLAAFQDFVSRYHAKAPGEYRDFALHLLSVGNDFVSQQVKIIGHSILGERFRVHASMPKEDAMLIASKCNAVICCSLNEAFPLYVAEAMLMQCVLLRNNCAGVDEQLVDGVNGYLIDTNDIRHFSSRIEKLLSKKTANTDLLAMSQASREMISAYTDNNYYSQILECA